MKVSEAPEESFGDVSPVRAAVQIQDFLWRPRSVKRLWLISFSYWGGMIAAEAKPDVLSFFHTVLGGYIGIFLCPPIVFMLLIGLFLRARFAQIDISDWDGDPEPDFYNQRHWTSVRYSESGGLLDPTIDPLNPQSGIIHLRHIGVLKH